MFPMSKSAKACTRLGEIFAKLNDVKPSLSTVRTSINHTIFFLHRQAQLLTKSSNFLTQFKCEIIIAEETRCDVMWSDTYITTFRTNLLPSTSVEQDT